MVRRWQRVKGYSVRLVLGDEARRKARGGVTLPKVLRAGALRPSSDRIFKFDDMVKSTAIWRTAANRQDRRYALNDHEPSAEVAGPGIDAAAGRVAVILSGIFVRSWTARSSTVAIPVIRSTLHASFGEAESRWQLRTGVLRRHDHRGTTWRHLRPAPCLHGGLCSITLTSFICGVAPNMRFLLLAGLLQGASAAMLSPQVLRCANVLCRGRRAVRQRSARWA